LKLCTRCNREKLPKEFFKHKLSRDGLRHWCKVCCSESNKAWARKNRRTTKNSELKHVYGITLVEVETLYDIQEGLCAICSVSISLEGQTNKNLKVHIDHNHKTGDIRGLLCGKCNSGLGMFKDKPSILENALSYLNEKGYYG